MLDQQTKQRINSARQILVGKIPDPKSQVEQITTALIYKFMDDMDRENEEIGRKATFLVGELAEFSWGKLMSKQVSGDERWNLYTRALEAFAKSKQIPELFRTIFKSAYLPYRDVQTLNLFLKEINEFTYDQSEKLGDAFEYLLSILGSQGDAGQFRTPRHLIDFITETVAPQKNEKILDPACGTAGFLISAYKYIKKYNSSNFDPKKDPLPFEHIKGKDVSELSIQSNGRYKGDKLNPDDRKKLAQNIHGYDIAPEMVRLSLVNMYLHGFVTPQIQEYDTLTFDDKWGENFDVILANPPFMTPKGGIRPHKKFSVSANRAEVLFVDYIAEHLTIKGRAGIIVPEGIIFQSANAYKLLRKNLIENWGLYAVVSLPAGVFQPYSGVKTSILFLDREIAKKTDEILFVKVENDGFDLGAQRRKIEKNDLPKAFEILKEWQKEQKLDENTKIAVAVEKEKIAGSGDYNLTGDRYREAVDYSNVDWEMVELGEIADVLNGYAFQSKKYTSEGIRILRITNVQKGEIIDSEPKFYPKNSENEISKYLLKKDDLLVSLTGNVGRVGLIKKDLLPAALNQRVACLRLKEKNSITKKYVFNILNSVLFEKSAISSASGIAQKNLSTEWLKKYKIPLPPLEIQKQIVEKLDSYQKVIDGAKQVVKNWKPNIKIESDWEMVELGKITEVARGGSPRPINKYITTDKDGINWVKIGDVAKGEKYITKTKQKIKPSGLTKTRQVKIGDFILSNSMSFGRPYIMKIDGAIHDGWLLIRIIDNKKLTQNFLYLILGSNIVQEQYEKMATGGVVKNLNSEIVRNVKIPLPPLETQKQIVVEIEAEQEIINQNKKLIEIFEEKIKNKIGEIWGE